jgi:hypothetical protein
MSRRFVESFFPSTTHYLATSSSSVIVHAYTSLFVPWWFTDDDNAVDAFCSSEVTLSMRAPAWLDAVAWSTATNNTTTAAASSSSTSSMITIRNPTLCIWAIWGALYGCRCSMALFRQWQQGSGGAPNEKRHSHHTQSSSSSTSLLLFSLAFAGYGIMNAVAIPLHCFFPVDDTVVLPRQYPLLWTLDTYWTGAFSTAIICAVGQEYLETLFSTRAGRLDTWATLWACIVCKVGLGGYCIWSVWGKPLNAVEDDNDVSVTMTLPLELWYLLPLLVAIVVAASARWTTTPPLESRYNIVISPACLGAVALVLAVVGLLADATACRYASRLFAGPFADLHASKNIAWWQCLLLDSVRAPAVAFGACNVAFVSLYQRATMPRRPWRLAACDTKRD